MMVARVGAWLDGQQAGHRHFILEAAGPYSERLIYTLTARQASFSVVNPAQSRGMSKALCKSNKTDEQDAQTLSLLGPKLEVIRVPIVIPSVEPYRRTTVKSPFFTNSAPFTNRTFR